MITIDIKEQTNNYSDMSDLLRKIADMIDEGYKTGYYPHWKVNGEEQQENEDVKQYLIRIDYVTNSGNPTSKQQVIKSKDSETAINILTEKVKNYKSCMKINSGNCVMLITDENTF